MVIGRFNKKKITIKAYLEIKEDLKNKSKKHSGSMTELSLSKEEREIISTIKEQTKMFNLNNVTRTKAYYDFFVQYPEIHWALLGHMVSRNGGWHMTDLKGDLINRLLSEKEQRHFFLFLERGNWLIFQDVYPQCLLYQQSLHVKKNLFYLLPHFGVSLFMETIWNYFWENGDCYLLAIAMVINEQSYLEKRVIQNPHFKKTVLNTLGFKLYDFLRFNHIIFPFIKKGKSKKISLIGETLQHFDSLHERIMLGKRLYSLLFQQESVLQGVLRWADQHPHSGSRKDYWHHLISSCERITTRIHLQTKEHKDCQLKKGAHRIYSPPLQFAWGNVEQQEAEQGDWFDDWRMIDYLMEEGTVKGGEIYDEYCKTIEKIELAIIAKKAIFLRQE